MKPFATARSALIGLRPLALLVGLLLLLILGLAPRAALAQSEGDPPGRVGRIADLSGAVWWFDVEQGQWSPAIRNRPITAGDRLSTGRDGRVELRIGSTTIKLAESSELEMLRLDDDRVRAQLHRGSVAWRLRSREVAAETEFGTDEAWLQPQRGGLYRLDREDDTSFASTWRGDLRVAEEPGLEIGAGRRLQLWREGTSRTLQHRWQVTVEDGFAARVLGEDRDDERSVAAAHVSTEMTGWEELDRHGRWEQHPEYGAVWTPAAVSSDWAPYRQGRWTWIRPWGWTWVDDAPWGFAPYHYGRWVSWRDRWRWVPGRYVARPVFAPALVAWIDGPGPGIGLRIGGPTLSWVPLAPWEVFRPHYRVSPGYHDRVNTPDQRRWRPPPRQRDNGNVHGNQDVPNAVTVVPSDVLRPRPPGVREPRDEHRPRVPDADRDQHRPGRDDRVTTPPPPRPPPMAPLAPLPTRQQPEQPAQPMQPIRPLQPAPVQPPPVMPTPLQPPPQVQPMRRPAPVVTSPATSPPPPQPPPTTTPPPPRAVPRAPAPAEPRPAARERERPTEEKKDERRDDNRQRPAEPRGSLR